MRPLLLLALLAAGCGSGEEKLQSMDAWRKQMEAHAPKDFEARLARADFKAGSALYQKHCLACHGPLGAGDGPLAAGLSPRPSDLRIEARVAPAADIYGDMARGLSWTAMAGFEGRLSEKEMLDVVAHVKRMK